MLRSAHRPALALVLLAALPLAQAASARPAGAEVVAALGVSDAEVVALELPAAAGEPFAFALPLEGAWREVAVEPRSVRAAGYELREQTPDGVVVHPPSVETSYRGRVAGFPDSVVAVNLFEGQVQGVVRLRPGGALHGVQPVSDVVPGAPRAEHALYTASAVLPDGARCGGAIDVLRGDPSGGGVPQPGADGTGTKICEIAIDADYEYFQSNGSSVPQTENDITNVINAVEAIYEDDVDVIYEITVIYVESSPADPYTTSSPGGLLSQFQGHWNTSHQGDPRDVAHLFTGKNLDGFTIGIAYLNVICNKSAGYGLSQSKYTGSFTSRVGLTAHELGHNWSAGHCDGAGDCWIMCSGIGGCGGSVTMFGSGSKAAISAKKASSGCLETAPPPIPPFLTGLSPSTVQAFQGGEVQLAGVGLEEVTELNVGAKVLVAPFDFTVEDDTLITFNAPTPDALGGVSVTAVNGAGTSNALTLTYVETDPAKLSATSVGLTGLAFNWQVGAKPGDLWFVATSVDDPTTFPYLGFDLLANGLVVGSGTLGPAGVGSLGIIVPPGASGASVYSQAVTLDAVTLAFDSATNIATSSILL